MKREDRTRITGHGPRIFDKHTIEDRLAQFGERARNRLTAHFSAARIRLPLQRAALLAFKYERLLEVYGAAEGKWLYSHRYPILAASGTLGPKLREGDHQVPEGIYDVVLLNPNSKFHVSLRLGYPNEFDRAMARADGRTNPGGDIMIHGSDRSVGCIAIGDEAAEEIFTLAATIGIRNVRVVVSPIDFRRSTFSMPHAAPSWTAVLYGMLQRELQKFPLKR